MISIDIDKTPQEYIFSLAEHLIKFPCISKRSIVGSLPHNIQNSFANDNNLPVKEFAINLITTCITCSYGIEVLVETIHFLNGDTIYYTELDNKLLGICDVPIPITKLVELKVIVQDITKDLSISDQTLDEFCASNMPKQLFTTFPLHQEYRSRLFCILDHMARKDLFTSNTSYYLLTFLKDFSDKFIHNKQTKVLIQQWIDAISINLGLELDHFRIDAVDYSNSTIEQYLLIDLELKVGTLDSYLITAWLVVNNQFKKIYAQDNGVLVNNVNDLLKDTQEILRKATYELHKLHKLHGSLRFIIEFLVPKDLICYEFDHLFVQENRPLGTKYPVVVRPRERMEDSLYWEEWQEKWNCITLLNFTCKDSVYWVCNLTQYKESSLRDNITHLILTTTFQSNSNIIATILNTGIPIAIFPRLKNINKSVLEQEFQTLLFNNKLFQIPYIIKKNRTDAWDYIQENSINASDNIWYNVTVLWDDPSRNPKDPLLVEP